MAVVFSLAFIAVIGFTNVLSGLVSRRTSAIVALCLANTISVAVLVVALPIYFPDNNRSDFYWGALGGFFLATGRIALYSAFATRTFSETMPYFGAALAIAPVCFAVIRGDEVQATTWIALLLAISAIVFLTGSERAARRESLQRSVLPLLAGALLGLHAVPLDEASGTSPLLVALGAHTLVQVFILPLALPRLRQVPISRNTLGVSAIIGVLFVASVVSLAEALDEGALAPVAIITSLTPLPTVLLGVLFFHERPTRQQLVGLALASISVALISLQ